MFDRVLFPRVCFAGEGGPLVCDRRVRGAHHEGSQAHGSQRAHLRGITCPLVRPSSLPHPLFFLFFAQSALSPLSIKVMSQLQTFKPDVASVKRRVASLIEREYLARHEDAFGTWSNE